MNYNLINVVNVNDNNAYYFLQLICSTIKLTKMKNFFLPLLTISLFNFSCSVNEDVLPETNLQQVTSFRTTQAMKQAVLNSYIKRIEISQLNLKKLSTGAQKTIDYSYNYDASVKFSIADDKTLSVEQSWAYPLINIGTFDTGNVKLNLNGQIYQGVLSTGNYDALVGGFANKKLVFSPPATDVPGVSGDYSVLIDALNKTGPINVSRPNLNIPNDLKVIGFSSITFYLF